MSYFPIISLEPFPMFIFFINSSFYLFIPLLIFLTRSRHVYFLCILFHSYICYFLFYTRSFTFFFYTSFIILSLITVFSVSFFLIWFSSILNLLAQPNRHLQRTIILEKQGKIEIKEK